MLSHEKLTRETPNYSSIEYPELPNGWEWRIGDRGDGHYSKTFGTEYRMGGPLAGVDGLGGYDGQVYWDRAGAFHVVANPITGIHHDGYVSGYPVFSRDFGSLQDAIDAVPGLVDGLGD